MGSVQRTGQLLEFYEIYFSWLKPLNQPRQRRAQPRAGEDWLRQCVSSVSDAFTKFLSFIADCMIVRFPCLHCGNIDDFILWWNLVEFHGQITVVVHGWADYHFRICFDYKSNVGSSGFCRRGFIEVGPHRPIHFVNVWRGRSTDQRELCTSCWQSIATQCRPCISYLILNEITRQVEKRWRLKFWPTGIKVQCHSESLRSLSGLCYWVLILIWKRTRGDVRVGRGCPGDDCPFTVHGISWWLRRSRLHCAALHKLLSADTAARRCSGTWHERRRPMAAEIKCEAACRRLEFWNLI